MTQQRKSQHFQSKKKAWELQLRAGVRVQVGRSRIARWWLCDARTPNSIPGVQLPPCCLRTIQIGGRSARKRRRLCVKSYLLLRFAVSGSFHYILIGNKDWDGRAEARRYGAMDNALLCDGCGQEASAEHIARRLERLEWATRYRPVHIHTLVLCAASQLEEKDFLYSPKCEFRGAAGRVLSAAGISLAGKEPEAVHAEFQRGGFFLTHVLECPFESAAGNVDGLAALLAQRLAAVATRIRRSLKPKRVVLVSRTLEPVLEEILALQLGCPVVLDGGKPFDFENADGEKTAVRLREALAAPVAG